MWANNETGVIFPVEKAAAMARNKGILFHTDAVQAVGKIPIDMRQNAIDMLSLSGHKLHAPKGIGVLYVRKGTKFSPFPDRRPPGKGPPGRHRKRAQHHRPGRGLPDWRRSNMEQENTTVKAPAGQAGKRPAGPHPQQPGERRPGAAPPQHQQYQLRIRRGRGHPAAVNEFGICASSGSACTSGSLQPSHVLRAMGVPFTMAHGSIRFSLSIYNTEEEIDFVIEKLPPIIERLRAMSPYWEVGERRLRHRGRRRG